MRLEGKKVVVGECISGVRMGMKEGCGGVRGCEDGGRVVVRMG